MNNLKWTTLNNEDLLKTRIKDLGLTMESAPFYPLIEKVRQELHQAGLLFSPRFYLGDEWFSPEGLNAIAIPFFLSHPRLMELERQKMLEVEGETEDAFMRLIRHECGHAFDHAFKVSKRRSWIKLFGSPSKKYDPSTYRPRPYSKNFVKNLGRWYAQSHPDEDFAETFAVIINPHSNWRSKYKGWKAYDKLIYVASLIEELKNKQSPSPKGRMMSDARTLTTTLHRYYQRRQRESAEEYPDFYDKDLLRIFTIASSGNKKSTAAKLMTAQRERLVESISHWTHEKKVTVNALIQRLAHRCRDLNLQIRSTEQDSLVEITGYLTTLVSNYLFTGHFRRRL